MSCLSMIDNQVWGNEMTDLTKAIYIDPVAFAAMVAAKNAGTWKPTWQQRTRQAC